MEKRKTELLAVVGPTASGKTTLAVELAQRLNGEIVSCDSMQIYKGMSVATAVPSFDERKGIRHHLIEFLEPEQSFSVKEYCELARKCIADIADRGKLPILCGGTGLYYGSLTQGIHFSEGGELPELREQLKQSAAKDGGEELHKRLFEIDPQTAARLSTSDTKRIIRAIEVYEATGRTMSESIRLSRLEPSDYALTAIGLGFADRQKLYDRINMRVDNMVENGLIEEAQGFFSRYYGKTAAQAIGYKELKPYLNGEIPLKDALDKLKMETRRYAKRQLTWFRRDNSISWLEVDECGEMLLDKALCIVKEGFYV